VAPYIRYQFMLKPTLSNSAVGAQGGQVVYFGKSVAKNARTANRVLDFSKASTKPRTHYPSAFLANSRGAPGLSMIPSETRNDPQPTKRNRFDSRSPFAPEIAARTPPSVPWTFPCLCVGFTSFLSTALLPPLEARLRSFGPVFLYKTGCTPAPATSSNCCARARPATLFQRFLLTVKNSAAAVSRRRCLALSTVDPAARLRPAPPLCNYDVAATSHIPRPTPADVHTRLLLLLDKSHPKRISRPLSRLYLF
jgi:hypothetical protein